MIMAAAGFLAAAAPAQAALVNEAPASSWQTDGKVNAIKATRTRVYIGGEFTTLKGKVRHRLGAVSPSSSAALINWSPNASSAVFALQVSANGKRIYVGGAFDHINGHPANHLAA